MFSHAGSLSLTILDLNAIIQTIENMNSHSLCHKYISSKEPIGALNNFLIYEYNDISEIVYDEVDDDFVFVKIDDRQLVNRLLRQPIHRTDGPAVINKYANSWYLNGKCHRTDGPAVEHVSGDKYWFLNGTNYAFEDWLKLTPLSSQEKLKLRLKYASK